MNNFRKMVLKQKNNIKSYCFVTGPSFDSYQEFQYEKEAFKIICNSIVKNHTFLEYIKGPDLLVFADPVFHFSPSEYSAVFRDHVLKVVERYNCFVMVPEATVGLLLRHYPELKPYLIGMGNCSDTFSFPSDQRLNVKSSANILTLFMLPVASSVSEEVYILGADGRAQDEKYFWKHSTSVQFDNLMQTVFETHPSFFRDRDYKDYYAEHCRFLESFIQYGERQGKRYFSLTPSHIPALKQRVYHMEE
jgi:hypothetical protein